MGDHVTVYVSDDVKDEMRKFKEVNWSEVCRKAIQKYIKARESTNPEASSKIQELKEGEKRKGYEYGMEIADELMDELCDYDTFLSFINSWKMVSRELPEILQDIMVYFNFKETPPEARPTETPKSKLKENCNDSGTVEWFIENYSDEEEFHKNKKFLFGVFEALEELLED